MDFAFGKRPGEEMLTRFSWLALIAVAFCALMSCGKNSNFSSTNTMYVATQSAAQVWGFRANFNNGSLSTINGSPFTAQPAYSILIDPSQSFAYLATAAGQILRYSFDLNGSLVPVSGSQGVPTGGTSPVALTMDSGGKFLFVANQGTGVAGSSSISVFSVGSGAALNPVPGSPFQVKLPLNFAVANPNPAAVGLVVQNAMNLLYVVDENDGYVLTYPFDPSTGILPANATQATLAGTSPAAAAMNAAGTFLYVANFGSNNVSGFAIGTTSQQGLGSLTPLDKSPFAAELGPISAAVDPSGQFLYVVDQTSNQISGYRLNPTTGDLTPTIGSPYNTGAGPVFVAISPVNRFLYVSNNAAATVTGFSIDPAGGNLSTVTPAVTTGTQPTAIAFGK
jgi:6-phosphogluconolactonase